MSGSVVITGAGSGIGAGLARRYGSIGHHVVLFDRNTDAIERLRDELHAAGAWATAAPGDVTVDDDLERLADILDGDIDAVFANAGIALGGVFDAVPMSEWEQLIDVNVLGVVRTINAFLPRLRVQRSGRIVVMSSAAGLFPDDPFHTPYAATKAALIALARSLSLQVAADGIDVSVVCPRLTDTPFPASATAWTPNGARQAPPPDLTDSDTVDDVVDAVVDGLDHGRFLISMVPDTAQRMADFAGDPDAYLRPLRRRESGTSTR